MQSPGGGNAIAGEPGGGNAIARRSRRRKCNLPARPAAEMQSPGAGRAPGEPENPSFMRTFVLMYFFVLFVLLYFYNLFGQTIQTSMQNLESLAQKMAELPLDAYETQQSIWTFMRNLEYVAQKMAEFNTPQPPWDKENSHNLLRQFIRGSTQNLESVAQKWLSYGHFLVFSY